MENLGVQWTTVQLFETESSASKFWMAIDIYVSRSHIINRRLIGGEILATIKIENKQQLQTIKHAIANCKLKEEHLQLLLKSEFLKYQCDGSNVIDAQSKYCIIKKVLPKNNSTDKSFEIIVKDYAKNEVSFLNVTTHSNAVPCFPYALAYETGQLQLWVGEGVNVSDPSCRWLVDRLVPKLVKWMQNAEGERVADSGSLRLVPVTEYSALYNKLKETYGKQLVQMWPENTDPLKFVYEDIGIATYLLLLWSDKPKQRFVDLGCGNGLLVHILNCEGHLGVGYDLRPRKIWSLYPPSTKLEVRTVIPSWKTVFPDTDWLIGNHSDELTVWIPIMAARSSFSCKFFLLPCCPYELDGSKYCRADTSVSQYSDFLRYVETVCEHCGIVTQRDKLRIPSTKRTCFIGKDRTFCESDLNQNLEKLQEFIVQKCGENANQEVWCPQFKPRSEERVRNCTQIDSNVQERIVHLVTEQLLAKKRISDNGWNCGGVVELNALARIVPKETLKELKSECGGLQTLLKNHHFIFKVQSGKVEFRVPTEKVKSESNTWKKRPCWFFHNHPNSCPLTDEKCSFVHDT